jgi:alkylation response protein AidB-like acyl-CoA dehydrogenase
VLLDPATHQVSASTVASLDHTRPLTRFVATRLDVDELAVVGVEDLERAWTSTIGIVAALDAVGTARVALTRTVDYAGTREQFGRPIGSFQAYKHRCASAFIDLRLAQALAFGAAEDESGALGLRAAVHCARTATRICSEAVVLHGGIGFTWEAGLHTHLKRARLDEVLASRHGRTAALLATDAR